MKKSLFFLAAAAIALVSCETGGKKGGTSTGAEVAKISFVESEIAFLSSDESEYALTVMYEPSDAAFDNSLLTYSVSNDSVVAVSPEGYVTVLGVGEATITATYNKLTAECKAYVVDDPMATITWGDAYLVGLGSAISADTIYIEDPDDGTFACLLHLGKFYFTDSNIGTDADGKFLGAGYVNICYAPIYVIYGGDYDGYYMGSRGGYAFIETEEELLSYYSDRHADDIVYAIYPQGIFDVEAYQTFIVGLYEGTLGWDSPEAEAYEAAIGNGGFQQIDFSTGSAYLTEGFLGKGAFASNAQYDFTVLWLDGVYGLAAEVADNDLGFEWITPYELVGHEVHYTAGDALLAPARAPKTNVTNKTLKATKVEHTHAIMKVK